MARECVTSLYFRFAGRVAALEESNRLLEELLARADARATVRDWRADAFRVIAPQAAAMPAVAAAALCALQAPVQAAWVCVATPVHYVAEMSNVRLARNGILTLSAAAAERLSWDFNRVWLDSGVRLQVGRFAELFCLFDHALSVTTRDPEEVLGRHIEEFLPQGADASRLRRLMSEVEMWLFEHATNRTRLQEDALPVTGLWLWGGGAVIAFLPPVRHAAAGEDLLFNYFRGDVSAGGVVVAPGPGGEGWPEAQSRWLEPAVEGLRSGRISRLTLSAGDHCFAVSARGLRRFWRRRKPWSAHFA
jgi:hypothetical protein